MTRRIIVVRHAHAVGNSREYIGRKDTPLSMLGQRQACRLARQLHDEPVARVLSSPLVRAQQTAASIASPRKLWLETDDALAELDIGHWQGQPKLARGQREPLAKRFRYDPVPGGESLWDVWQRVERVSRLLNRVPAGQTVAVVAHYWPCRFLVAQALAMPFEAALKLPYKPRNAQWAALSF